MSETIYKILKYLCQIALPAIGGLYFALAQIWGLPYAEEIVGTLSAIAACIGVLLGISSYRYYKGQDNG